MKRILALATALAAGSLSLGLVSATAATAASSLPNPGGLPMMKAPPTAGLPTIAYNWSGYAVTSRRQFNYVHAQFVQPALTCSGKPNQWTSNWTGLDGFTNGTVEQDGTFATCGGKTNMTPQYFAWYEMFPAGSVVVFKVAPGDVIDSSVHFANGMFSLTIADTTSGKSVTKTAACSQCPRASAEAIIERPALCGNAKCTKAFITPLADFGTTAMSGVMAGVQGQAPRGFLSFTNNYSIFMVQPTKSGFYALDEVSGLNPKNQSFEVLFLHSGAPVPISL